MLQERLKWHKQEGCRGVVVRIERREHISLDSRSDQMDRSWGELILRITSTEAPSAPESIPLADDAMDVKTKHFTFWSQPPSTCPHLSSCQSFRPTHESEELLTTPNRTMASVPRQLRACLVCSFVQPLTKFSKGGCPNCEDFLEMRGNGDAVADCTSEVFEGLVTVNDTNNGWVAKWLRIQGYVPGVYAVKVNGLVGSRVHIQRCVY